MLASSPTYLTNDIRFSSESVLTFKLWYSKQLSRAITDIQIKRLIILFTEKLQACSQTEELSIADLTNTELQAQLEDLGLELDKRYNKKQKYKQMYMVGNHQVEKKTDTQNSVETWKIYF